MLNTVEKDLCEVELLKSTNGHKEHVTVLRKTENVQALL